MLKGFKRTYVSSGSVDYGIVSVKPDEQMALAIYEGYTYEEVSVEEVIENQFDGLAFLTNNADSNSL